MSAIHLNRNGRKPGAQNRHQGDIKAMILEALRRKGGADYLERQADENPVAFIGLVGRLLPKTVVGDPERPIVLTTAERELEARNLIRAAFGKPLLTIEHITQKEESENVG
jgi:hypothetical protein